MITRKIKGILTSIILIAVILAFSGCNRRNNSTATEPSLPSAAEIDADTLANGLTQDNNETTDAQQAAAQTEATEDDFEFYDISITKYKGTAASVSIPGWIRGNEITEIQHRVFEGKQLTDVVIPNGITVIMERAFANNRLTNVEIPETMMIISYEAFTGNPLTSIKIGADVELGLVLGLGERGIAFSEAFDNAYNSGGKKAGTYSLKDGVWVLEKWRYADLYFPGTDGFIIMKAYTYEATAEDIVFKLTEIEALPEGSACLSFTINGRRGHADMNAVYGNALKNTGTAGENALIGSLVNTLLIFFDLDEITLTAEGKIIETGHVIWEIL